MAHEEIRLGVLEAVLRGVTRGGGGGGERDGLNIASSLSSGQRAVLSIGGSILTGDVSHW